MKPERIRHKKHHLPRLYYVGQVCVAITACIEARPTEYFETPRLSRLSRTFFATL
jgi:hypothetical protein